VEEYAIEGPRFKLMTVEDCRVADAAFQDLEDRCPGWTFAQLYDEVFKDKNHPLRPYMTSPDKALRSAWIKDLRAIAHEIKVYRYRPQNGDKKVLVSVRKWTALDIQDGDVDGGQPVVSQYDAIRVSSNSMEAVHRLYARRLRALVTEFVGYGDTLTRFRDLEKLAASAELAADGKKGGK